MLVSSKIWAKLLLLLLCSAVATSLVDCHTHNGIDNHLGHRRLLQLPSPSPSPSPAASPSPGASPSPPPSPAPSPSPAARESPPPVQTNKTEQPQRAEQYEATQAKNDTSASTSSNNATADSGSQGPVPEGQETAANINSTEGSANASGADSDQASSSGVLPTPGSQAPDTSALLPHPIGDVELATPDEIAAALSNSSTGSSSSSPRP